MFNNAILNFLIIIIPTMLYSEIKIGINCNYFENDPYFYRNTVIPNYIYILSNRISFRNVTAYNSTLELNIMKLKFEGLFPYYIIEGNQTNNYWGDFELRLEYSLIDFNYLKINFGGGITLPSTNGQNKYLFEINTSNGSQDFIGYIKFNLTYNKFNFIYSPEIIRKGKNYTERRYDLLNYYQNGLIIKNNFIISEKYEYNYFIIMPIFYFMFSYQMPICYKNDKIIEDTDIAYIIYKTGFKFSIKNYEYIWIEFYLYRKNYIIPKLLVEPSISYGIFFKL